MFNNLGLYGGAGFPGALFPVIRQAPIRRVLPIVPRTYAGQAVANFGGNGNDVINIGGGGGVGPPGPPGPPGTIGLVPVTIVTTTPFTPALANYLLEINVAGPSSVVLPVSPTGTVFIVKDLSGLASTNNITVTATGGVLIDGAASALINTNYGSLTFIFNGTQWSIV